MPKYRHYRPSRTARVGALSLYVIYTILYSEFLFLSCWSYYNGQKKDTFSLKLGVGKIDGWILVVVIWTRGCVVCWDSGSDMKYLKMVIFVNFKKRCTSLKIRKLITKQVQ